MSISEPSFAIVIIGRNEGPRLHDCLKSALKSCSAVIYADSASTDGSTELARSMGAHVVCVDSSAPLNAARGRNAGLDLVKRQFPGCKFIQFIDGDCLLAEGWIELALNFLQSHPRAAVVCGRRYEAHPGASLYNRLADEEWDTAVGLTEACGGDSMVRMSALQEVGGFNPNLMASEEPELCARMREFGWEIWRIEGKMTEHDAQMFTFAQWWRRTLRSGHGYAQAWLSTRKLARPINGKTLRSATVWALVVPAMVLIFTLVARELALLLLLPTAYLIQVLRISNRETGWSLNGLQRSSMLMLAKVPEFIGAASELLGAPRSMIEYKVSVAKPTREPS